MPDAEKDAPDYKPPIAPRDLAIATFVDPDFGAIAVARDESGAIISSASSGIERGVYTAVDEASFYEATGRLLPVQAWEQALLDDHDGEAEHD